MTTNVRILSRGNSHLFLVGIQIGTVTLKDRLAGCLTKLNITLNHTFQQLSSQVSTQMSRKLTSTQNAEQECWQQFCSWMLKPGSNQDVLSVGDGWPDWHIHVMEYYFLMKRNEPSATKRQGGILNAHWEMKETTLQRLYTVWFQLYDMLKKAKLW